jgi:hypothetical protein
MRMFLSTANRAARLVLLWALTLVAIPLALGGCKPNTPQAAPFVASTPVEEKVDPIGAIANLSDPEKLKTLKPEARGVNGRFDKILYWLFVAEQKGIPPVEAIDQAFESNGTREPRRSMAKEQLQSAYLTAKLWGLFTPENCTRLKRGNAGLITKGTYIGQIAEVDHIIPLSRYPQFANELANLQLMPAMQNRAKGNRMGEVEFEKLKQLQVLSPSPVTKN